MDLHVLIEEGKANWQIAVAGLGVGALLTILIYLVAVRRGVDHRIERELRERKDQFIALTSHYLLNPITIIQTALASLREKGGEIRAEERDQLYDAIERGQQRLWILAEQLAMVGEIDQGDLHLTFAVSDLKETVQSAIEVVDAFARAKKIVIHFQADTHNVDQTRFDARRLRQAIIAVLDNAVKFSLEEGTIEVGLALDQGFFTITVTDHGIGMPEEVLDHITERFYRGTQLYSFDYEGLGLGLHIAQAIVRLHNGVLSFDSKPRRGTTAVIQFPNL